MTQRDWTKILARGMPWRECYPVVAEAARECLAPRVGLFPLKTADLVQALWPDPITGIEHSKARSRMFKALMAQAEHELADCCTAGEPFYHKGLKTTIRPWLWHAPDPSKPRLVKADCPTCKGTGYIMAPVYTAQDKLDDLSTAHQWRHDHAR